VTHRGPCQPRPCRDSVICFSESRLTSQLRAEERQQPGLYDHAHNRNLLPCSLTNRFIKLNREEEEEKVGQNPILCSPFPEPYCMTGPSNTATTSRHSLEIATRAGLPRPRTKLRRQKNHRKSLRSHLIHKHSQH